MHNFGETRWGSEIIDDIRSLNDRKTRIIGDFTKMVRTAPIVRLMYEVVSNEKNWVWHFRKLIADTFMPVIVNFDSILPILMSACKWLAENSTRFRRPSLQTRFFEVGDNFYHGMEFPREYIKWRSNLTHQIVTAINPKQSILRLDHIYYSFSNSIDRLWYFACLETIRTGDVYNPGARHRVPRLYLVNSIIPSALGSLPIGESCRLLESPAEKYEVLATTLFASVLRNVEGYVLVKKKSTLVTRESNLTRCPDGNHESKVVSFASQVTTRICHLLTIPSLHVTSGPGFVSSSA